MIEVTDHAIVRYMERILGVELDGVREQIASSLDSPRARRLVEFGGGAPCKVTVAGVVYCMQGHTVTTVLDDRSKRSASRRFG